MRGAVGAVLLFTLDLLLSLSISSIYTRRHICSVSRFNLGTGDGGGTSPIIHGTVTGVGTRYHSKRGIVLHFPTKHCGFRRTNSAIHRCCVSGRSRSGPGGIKVTLRSVGGLAVSKRNSRFIFCKEVVPISLLHSRGYMLGDFDVSFRRPRVTRMRIMRGSPRGKVAFRPTP